jgi:hypothetical protein
VSAGQAWTTGPASPLAAWVHVWAVGRPSGGAGGWLGWLLVVLGRVIAATVTTACATVTWLVQQPGGVALIGFLAAVAWLATWGVAA